MVDVKWTFSIKQASAQVGLEREDLAQGLWKGAAEPSDGSRVPQPLTSGQQGWLCSGVHSR